MEISFEEYSDDIDSLIRFLTSDTWNFHGESNPSEDKIREHNKNQVYTGEDCKTFWVIFNGETKVGMIRIFDLQDSTPLFDIRICSKYRGMGIGTTSVKWLVEYIFTKLDHKERIEGYTREDNFAMRNVFDKCSFIKEAHHRKAWKDNNGKLYDAIGYAILKEDWLCNKITKVNFNDFMHEIVDYRKHDFYITSDYKKLDINVVSSLLKESYWANTRDREVVIKSIENSLCFSLFHNDRQIGFTRVITDCATFAYLCDVIISDEYRHNGLGGWLIDCVLKHPDLQNLRRWFLITKDAQEFYKKHGFNNLITPERFMEIFNE